MADAVVKLVQQRAVVTIGGGELVALRAAQAALPYAQRAEEALAQIEDIATGAPDAPSILNKVDKDANGLDFTSIPTLRSNIGLDGRVFASWYAAGDGTTNDTAAFATLEGEVSGLEVDLGGLTYLVDSLPIGNTYINGYFLTSNAPSDPTQRGVTYVSDDAPGMISGLETTGGFGAAYSGGVNNTPTVPGRSTRNRRVIVGSQGCRSDFNISGNFVCIYSWAYGNVSGNFASRQSVAGCPQAVNIASEEGQAYGFGAVNLNAQFCIADGTKVSNMTSRLCYASSARYAGNYNSNGSRAGGGWGAVLTPTFTAGVVTAVTINSGGEGYDTNHIMSITARQTQPTTDAVFSFTVDANGTITSVTIVNGGAGYVASEYNDIRVQLPSESKGEGAGNYSTIASRSHGRHSANIATSSAINRGDYSLIGGSTGSNTTDTAHSRQVVLASADSSVAQTGGMALSMTLGKVSHVGSVGIGRRVDSFADRTFYGGDATSGSALTSNRTFQIGLGSGNAQFKGTVTGSATFTDYAELFENLTPGVIPLGTMVALEGRKVRPWAPGDRLHGVISATALIVAGDSPFTWQGRYLTGEFGENLYEDVDMVRWEGWPAYDGPVEPNTTLPEGAETWRVPVPEVSMVSWPNYDGPVDDAPQPIPPEAHFWTEPARVIRFARWSAREAYDGSVAYAQELGLTPPEDAVFYSERHQIENPDYDPEAVNIPRSERPDQWSCVGLIGQVHVRVDRDYAPDELITDGLRCMEMRTPFDPAKGYGVAFCYLNAVA